MNLEIPQEFNAVRFDDTEEKECLNKLIVKAIKLNCYITSLSLVGQR
jgi:hypothetical protein